MATRRIDSQLEAVSAKWGKKHSRTITCAANTADALDGLYLPINYFTPNLVEVNGYVWFNGAGAGTDPAPSGKTLIGSVSVTGGSETAAQVAAALKTTLDAAVVSGSIKAFMTSTVSGSGVTVENHFIGEITAETDADSTGCTFATVTSGMGLDLGGFTDGAELSFETNVTPIKSNQTGEIVGSEIYQGASASISMNLTELTKARLVALIGEVTGASVTPSGGTAVVGYGESKLFQALDELGGQLILHPIRLASTDYSADWIFWKSAPKASSINFDGTSQQAMATEFVAYLDQAIQTEVNLFMHGDWTQDRFEA